MNTCTACHRPIDKLISIENRELCKPCAIADYRPCVQCGAPVNVQNEGDVKTDHYNNIYCEQCAGELIECDDCEKMFPGDEITEIDGNNYCEACRDKSYTKCVICRNYFENGGITNIDGGDICTTCRDENYTTCDRCGEWVENEDTVSVESETWCERCSDTYTCTCDDCGDRLRIRNSHDIGDSTYCESCAEHYVECAECGGGVHTGYALYNHRNDTWYCERCGNTVNENINSHDYKPKPIFIGKNANPLYYIGIELETEKNPDSIAQFITDNYNDMMYCKEDGSLTNGVEIVTHPIGENYPHAVLWEDVLKNVKKQGGTSYESGNCGIHIHVTKSYFSPSHLYKIMKFIYENPAFILLVSQRGHNELKRWASPYPEDDTGRTIVYKAMNKSGNYSRYIALNLQNEKTIEFRIFRGTLKLESFLKNIEFIRALIAWAKDISINQVTKAQFLNYIQINAIKYYNLCNYLSHKGEF